jgi:hypothetical protein
MYSTDRSQPKGTWFSVSSESSFQKKSCAILTYFGVDEQEVHLEEREERLENRVSEDDLRHAPLSPRRVHGNFQAGEDECSQAENCRRKKDIRRTYV